MFSCLLLVASVSIYVHFWWTGIIGDIIQVINYGAGLFTSLGAWLVSMIMAIEMVRNLQNQKQERVFELMLTTPITDQDWIRQRLKAAWKAYGIPILLLGVLGLVLAGDFQMATLNDKPLSLSEKGVHGIVLLGSCISQWYFFATLSLFVGLSSRTMGNAVGTFILIYFGFHIVSSIFGAILTLLFILPSYFLSFFKNQMFLMSILASIPTIGMQVLVGWLFHDLLKKSFRKWTTES